MAVEMTDVGLWMWCVRKLRAGRAALAESPYRREVLSVAPGRRVWRVRRRNMIMSERAPVVSATLSAVRLFDFTMTITMTIDQPLKWDYVQHIDSTCRLVVLRFKFTQNDLSGSTACECGLCLIAHADGDTRLVVVVVVDVVVVVVVVVVDVVVVGVAVAAAVVECIVDRLFPGERRAIPAFNLDRQPFQIGLPVKLDRQSKLDRPSSNGTARVQIGPPEFKIGPPAVRLRTLPRARPEHRPCCCRPYRAR